MSRELENINQSGALTIIKLGGTGDGKKLLTSDEIDSKVAGSNIPFSEWGDVLDYQHIYKTLTNEFLGGVKTTGEFYLVYLLTDSISSDQLNIGTSVEVSELNISDIKVWSDSNNNVLAYIDENGRFVIPNLKAVDTFETMDNETAIKIWKDADGNVIMYIDDEGVVNIPHLASPDIGGNVGDRLLELERKILATMASVQLTEMNEPRQTVTNDRKTAAVLAETNEFSSVATNPSARKSLFAFVDDDSLDNHLVLGAGGTRGGFWTRFHPVFASRGAKFTESFNMRRIQENATNPGDYSYPGTPGEDLNDMGLACKALVDHYGMEMSNHSYDHSAASQYKVDDIADANSLGMNTGTTSIYSVADDKCYEWSGSAWVEMETRDVGVMIGDKTVFPTALSTSSFTEINPCYDFDFQVRLSQTEAERLGLGPVTTRCWEFGWHPNEAVEYAIKTHRWTISYGNYFNNNTTERITPPICRVAPRYIPISSDWLAGSPLSSGWLATTKAQVDLAISEGSSIMFMTHAYGGYWENENPAYPAYPASWKIPVQNPSAGGNFWLPSAAAIADGATEWVDWEPVEGTNLHDLWELIGYIQGLGYEVTTAHELLSRNANLMNVGNYTAGKRRFLFDETKYPHYVVGVDGSSSYYQE